MKASELKKDEIITEWLKSRRVTRNTTIGYLQAMQFYIEFTGQIQIELLDKPKPKLKRESYWILLFF